MVKVNGQWFFTKRKIFNEGSARWQVQGRPQPGLVVVGAAFRRPRAG